MRTSSTSVIKCGLANTNVESEAKVHGYAGVLSQQARARYGRTAYPDREIKLSWGEFGGRQYSEIEIDG